MGPQLLVPRVQYHGEADFGTKFLAPEDEQRLGHGIKEEFKERPLVSRAGEDERVQCMGQCKDVVEVRHRQEFGPTGLHPGLFGHRLALGAVTVAATMVGVPLESAAVAPLAVTATNSRAAVDDVAHHLPLATRKRMGLLIRFTVALENVCHFTAGPVLCHGFRTVAKGHAAWVSAGAPWGIGNKSSGLLTRPNCLLVRCR